MQPPPAPPTAADDQIQRVPIPGDMLVLRTLPAEAEERHPRRRLTTKTAGVLPGKRLREKTHVTARNVRPTSVITILSDDDDEEL